MLSLYIDKFFESANQYFQPPTATLLEERMEYQQDNFLGVKVKTSSEDAIDGFWWFHPYPVFVIFLLTYILLGELFIASKNYKNFIIPDKWICDFLKSLSVY